MHFGQCLFLSCGLNSEKAASKGTKPTWKGLAALPISAEVRDFAPGDRALQQPMLALPFSSTAF